MTEGNFLETADDPYWSVFNRNCPTRQVLDRIADKWTVLVIRRLSFGTLRFAEIRRAVEGVSQKVLTNTLRGLERDGIVTRQVFAAVPPRVEYSLTDLGKSLSGMVEGICCWAEQHISEVQSARTIYDSRPKEPDTRESLVRFDATNEGGNDPAKKFAWCSEAMHPESWRSPVPPARTTTIV